MKKIEEIKIEQAITGRWTATGELSHSAKSSSDSNSEAIARENEMLRTLITELTTKLEFSEARIGRLKAELQRVR